MSNPMTAEGDLIIGGAVSGGVAAPARLAAGTSGDVLTSNGAGAAPSWQPSGGGSNATSIQGVAVDSTAPTTGQVLEYNGTEWAPATASSSGNSPWTGFENVCMRGDDGLVMWPHPYAQNGQQGSYQSSTTNPPNIPTIWFSTGTASGDWCNSKSNDGITAFGFNSYFQAYVGLSTNNSTSPLTLRAYFGLTTNGDGDYGDSLASSKSIMFRFDTSLGDTTWHCVTSNGSSQNVVDSGVIVNNAEMYLLEYQVNDTAGTVSWKINGNVVATSSGTLPPSGTNANAMCTCANLTTSDQNSMMFVSWYKVRSNS